MALYEHSGVRPRLGAGVFVADGAAVIGDVVLGDEASVWFNTTVRGDVFPIRVGARTNIQDGSVLHVTNGKAATTLGDDVTVGHLVLLHGCTVQDRCLIGMGSTILDGAVIGEGSLLGAGSLVPPRMVIPPRSFAIGRPAKILRTVTEADTAMIREAGAHYVAYAKTYLSSAVRRIDP
jgi:carbonic anhydrase/acetyltransferase-like protein (isoleucine patch superfamily)